MRANVDILEKYIENLVIKKNLLDSSVEAYKMDMKKYGSKAMGLAKNIDKFGRTIQSEHALYVKNHRNG